MGFIFKGDTGSDLAAGGSLPGRDSISAEKEPAVNIFWPVIHCCLPLQSCFLLP